MSNAIKKIVGRINNNVELEKNLPAYAVELNTSYYQYSLNEMAMNYYLLYEMCIENEEYSKEDVKKIMNELNDIVDMVFVKGLENDAQNESLEKIENLRNSVRERMDVITDYTERFLIYEYVLNRIEYNFDESKLNKKKTMDENQFVGEIYRYIFSSDDNVVVNDKIKSVIAQLPVRITKSKFMDLVANSIKLYNKSDIASVKSYIYSIKGSSMLYVPKGRDSYFTDIKEILETFEKTDYGTITEEEFGNLSKIHKDVVETLGNYSDVYLSIMDVINKLYVIILTDEYADKESYIKFDKQVCSKIVCDILDLFKADEKAGIAKETDEELVKLEGRQEDIQYEYMQLESALMQVVSEHQEDIEKYSIEDKFKDLEKCSMLLSTSSFVELVDDDDSYKSADDEYCEKVKDELTADLLELFDRVQTPVRRAIMANVLGKLPVFFTSSNEVKSYIANSFSACRNKAEKNASIDLLTSIIYSEAEFLEDITGDKEK